MSEKDQPPGSDKAVEAGCTCPIIDNHHGHGRPYGGGTSYWVSSDCPLHGYSDQKRTPLDDQNLRDHAAPKEASDD
jgi:hypothetical protein